MFADEIRWFHVGDQDICSRDQLLIWHCRGTGLFIGSGNALSTGGPASLLISYILIGVVLFCTVQALGEMAVTFPVAGSFSAFATRFLDPALGFAIGWNYALQWCITMPLEIMAATSKNISSYSPRHFELLCQNMSMTFSLRRCRK